MTTLSWIRKLFTRPATRTIRKAPRRVHLALETLEDRTLLSGTSGPLDSFLLTPVADATPIAMHIHPHLTILINGQDQVIPAGIGVEASGDLPMHTHDDSGTIHIESPVVQ